LPILTEKDDRVITEEYQSLNKELHKENSAYGASGYKWSNLVGQTATVLETRDILDYGCGKRTLAASLGFPIHNYDPAFEEYSKTPEPADLVVCTDVLEHIEPECLDAVLSDIARVTKQMAFINVSTRPATKTLADGRNAHLIQQPTNWWVKKMCDYFRIVDVHALGKTGATLLPIQGTKVIFLVEPLNDAN